MERDEFLSAVKEKFTAEQATMLGNALLFAEQVHAEQKRESGEPYIIHPVAVAEIVMNMGMDVESVAAALLHDCVEDGEQVTVDMVAAKFGKDVAMLVDGVTKLTISGKQTYITKKQEQAENLRKLFLAIAADVRVVIIKLADRLHNMRTLAYCNPYKRMRKAKETLEVYAPLAHRFGMGAIKGELEDLSFRYLMPDEYADIKRQFERQREGRDAVLEEAMVIIERELKEAGIIASISGRPKHLYSVFRKMQRQSSSINEIYDLIAIRVIVDSINDCYAALGVLHANWKPLPGRFKDYIATPKPNMYRSLHTTLLSKNGIPFEVQIRTQEMHRTAEYGIAAHWMYKEGRMQQSVLDQKASWMRQILETKDSTNDSKEFVDNILKDFLGEYVFVLSPRGEIFDLPKGSTPLDFAYRVHTNIGHHCQGARVNGNIVRLDYKLKTNDMVEIITSGTQAGPSLDWLKIVKTQSARNRIRQWFKKENREENIVRGKDNLENTAKRLSLQLAALMKPEYVAEILKRHNLTNVDDLYATIGFGGISATQVLHKLVDMKRKDDKTEALNARLSAAAIAPAQDDHANRPTPVNGVIVHGDAGLAVRFGNCCNPIPGDPIVGYITRGRGVSIHRTDCSNIENLRRDTGRIIDAEWAIGANTPFRASLEIHAVDKPGALLEISALLSGMNISIVGINGKPSGDGKYTVRLTFSVTNAAQLDQIMSNLRNLKCVTDVYRVDK